MAINDHTISGRIGTIGPRGFLAGTGASGSLLAAALVALLSVTAFVAFDEVPFGGGGGAETAPLKVRGSAAVSRDVDGAGAGAADAIVLGPGPGAPGGGARSVPGAARGRGPDAGSGGGSVEAGNLPGRDVQAPEAPQAAAANPVDQAVAGVDGTVEGVTGANPHLADATKPLTSAVGQAAQGLTGSDVGGHLDDLTGSQP